MMKMTRFPAALAAAFCLAACALALAAGGASAGTPGPSAHGAPTPLPSPEDLLAAVRRQFRSHRPPPPYEVYTLVRTQQTNYGQPDYPNSYTKHYWYRSSDHAALVRRTTDLGFVGPLEFERPLFNSDRDPGPPTADIFEPAPLHTLAPDFVPTPEGTLPPIIATVHARGEFDYRVQSVAREGSLIHLVLEPRRDPDRNRLRALWVDANTLDLVKVVATDKLFIEHGPVFPVLFTIKFVMFDGIPTITHIHGVVGGGYDGDGATVDYDFNDTSYPVTLPDWYFNPRTYAQHQGDAPDPQ